MPWVMVQELTGQYQWVQTFYMHIDANHGFDDSLVLPNAEFETDVLALMFTRSIAAGEHIGALTVILPVGGVDGGLAGTQFQGKSSGAGDLIVMGLINLYGVGALSPQEYATFVPHSAVDILFMLSLPTGEFDRNKSINLGTDRWSLRVGMPLLHFFSWGPGETNSLEIIPSVTLFTDKINSSASVHQLEQDLMFTVEGHFTHDFSPMLWGSLDALYTAGGETTQDGVAQDNKQRSLGLGVTLGLNFSRNLNAFFSYGETVEQNENGMDGSMLRLKFGYIF